MRLALLFGLCMLPLGVRAQQGKSIDVKTGEYKRRGAEALAGIQALSKRDVCGKAVSTVEMLDCLQKGNDEAGKLYKAYVLAVGGLIRLEMSDPLYARPGQTTGRLAFDEGETAWLRYRDQTCSEQFDLAHGGTLAPVEAASCAFTITIAHVRELDQLYSELFQ